MLLITKELAEAVIAHHTDRHETCYHCDGSYQASLDGEITHDDNCIVIRAKLLLEKEWGIVADAPAVEPDLFADAPEGTTHWGEETADHHASWYKLENNQWYCISVDAWRVHKPLWYGLGSTVTDMRKIQLLERKA
jgi:hypothetical protein